MPKIVDHNQYRKELLSKCFDLFAQKGYCSITMREIAQCLGVSTGTLYHYFPSKKMLFEQLAEEATKQDVIMATAELEGTQTLQERMDALGKFMLKNEDYFIKWNYILIDYSQHKDHKEVDSISLFKRLETRYRQAINDVLGIHDPMLISFVLAMIDGLILQRLWDYEKGSFTEQFSLIGEMLTIYLKEKVSQK